MKIPNNMNNSNYKAGFPYLVDIGISTACPFRCSFCYTSSNPKGEYAEYQYLEDLVHVLLLNNVFEVVFGGGEPTLFKTKRYPQIQTDTTVSLVDILKMFKQRGFKTGITTKNYQWFKSDNFSDALSFIDSVAISVNTLEELDLSKNLKEKIMAVKGSEGPKVYIQNILGLSSWEDLKTWLMRAKELYMNNITFLGYKDFGRGTECSPHEIPIEWIDYVKELQMNIGVDAILANKFKKELISRGVKDYYLVGTEGKATCYIDAVRKLVRPFSYSDEGHQLDLKPFSDRHKNADMFRDIFALL